MGLFDGRAVRRHQVLVFQAAKMVAQEDERVYRNQVSLLAETLGPTALAAPGLLKVRLLGVCFPLEAFILRWGGKRQTDVWDMTKALSGVAAAPLMDPGAELTCHR